MKTQCTVEMHKPTRLHNYQLNNHISRVHLCPRSEADNKQYLEIIAVVLVQILTAKIILG